ncbi:hypothetical protein TTHERM_00497930 (macronuclear) [Tetrahymena thermophila SB210]|uniref:Uncharacterized protein n=1 Tax=Tetrahymena thermophila (strain SB210) TaxID=312017 RepID=I7MK22_TETTS|nr:hypothetical protein TTHERM_00497930 [Tetrahymena thermophila SB210]EAS07739.2 hypothetical protein TTHERM_00497930 [Tetrahymena thermophila SB210]|eukprot:XP_001027981.2 hypothetical protein TTHERM_00497930 [Tetrahymena thermophila SB210]
MFQKPIQQEKLRTDNTQFFKISANSQLRKMIDGQIQVGQGAFQKQTQTSKTTSLGPDLNQKGHINLLQNFKQNSQLECPKFQRELQDNKNKQYRDEKTQIQMQSSTNYSYRNKSQSVENNKRNNYSKNPAQYLKGDKDQNQENERQTTSQNSLLNGGVSVCIREDEDFVNVGNLIDEIKEEDFANEISINQEMPINQMQSVRVQVMQAVSRNKENILNEEFNQIETQEIAANLMETRKLAVCINDNDKQVKSYMQSLLQSMHAPFAKQNQQNLQNEEFVSDENSYNYATNSINQLQKFISSKQNDSNFSSVPVYQSQNYPIKQTTKAFNNKPNLFVNNSQNLPIKDILCAQNQNKNYYQQIQSYSVQKNSQLGGRTQDSDEFEIQGVSLLKQKSSQSTTSIQSKVSRKIQNLQNQFELENENGNGLKLYEDIPIEGINNKQGLIQQVYISPTSNKSQQINFQISNQNNLLTQQSSTYTLNTLSSAEKAFPLKQNPQIIQQAYQNYDKVRIQNEEIRKSQQLQQGIKLIGVNSSTQETLDRNVSKQQITQKVIDPIQVYDPQISLQQNTKYDTQQSNSNMSLYLASKRSMSNYCSNTNQYNTQNSNGSKSLERKKKIFDSILPQKQPADIISLQNFITRGLNQGSNQSCKEIENPIKIKDMQSNNSQIIQYSNNSQPQQVSSFTKQNTQRDDLRINNLKQFQTQRNGFQLITKSSEEKNIQGLFLKQSDKKFKQLEQDLNCLDEKTIKQKENESNTTKAQQHNQFQPQESNPVKNDFQKNREQFNQNQLSQLKQTLNQKQSCKDRYSNQNLDEFQTSTIEEQNYDIQVKQLEPFKFNKFLQPCRNNKFENETQSNQSHQSNERPNQNLTIKHVQGQNTTAASFLDDLSILKNANQQLQTTFEIENILNSELKKEQQQIDFKQKRMIFETGSSRNNSSQRNTINSNYFTKQENLEKPPLSQGREQAALKVQILAQNNNQQNIPQSNQKILILKDMNVNNLQNQENQNLLIKEQQGLKIIQTNLNNQKTNEIKYSNENENVYKPNQQLKNTIQIKDNEKKQTINPLQDQKRKTIFYNTERKQTTGLSYLEKFKK